MEFPSGLFIAVRLSSAVSAWEKRPVSVLRNKISVRNFGKKKRLVKLLAGGDEEGNGEQKEKHYGEALHLARAWHERFAESEHFGRPGQPENAR